MKKTQMRNSRLFILFRELSGGARQQGDRLNSPRSFLFEHVVEGDGNSRYRTKRAYVM